MRYAHARTTVAALLLLAAVAILAPSAGASEAPVYYVALGDSLATGAQPAPSGVENRLLAANGTNRGYVDSVYAAKRDQIPNLRLRKFGCGGETTTSMLDGSLPRTTCAAATGTRRSSARPPRARRPSASTSTGAAARAVQPAVDAAHDGDRIAIGPGTFAGGITIEKSVDLVGTSAAATIIRGGGPVLTIGSRKVNLERAQLAPCSPPTTTSSGTCSTARSTRRRG